MALHLDMAIPRVKSTYSLDLETVDALDDLARRWGVSKSEVLRRAVRAAAEAEEGGAGGPLGALDALQASAHLTRAKADAWVREVRAERQAAARKGRQ
jgi:Arc/MetJ-type ribon-helix-helix transcriptional regulator